MVIVLTNSEDATSDFLCEKLHQNTIRHCRLNTDSVMRECRIDYSISKASLSFGNNKICSTEVRAVWLRRPKHLHHTEALSPELGHAACEWMEALEGFLAHIPENRWINHPTANARASHKIEQLTRASQAGLRVPDSLLTQNPEAVRAFWRKYNRSLVVKPLSSGYIERQNPEDDSVIYTSGVSERSLENLDLVSQCPTLFQEQIAKESDVRVCFLDGEMVAVDLIAIDQGRQRLDIRRNNMQGVNYRVREMPLDVQSRLTELLQSYALRFAAVDFAIDEKGNWIFLEINPNGQWAWLDLECDAGISELFVNKFKADA